MTKSAQKIKSSTQKFTEIENIRENVVLLTNGNACMIIEVEATNFALLSQEEQMAKISAYANLLNSLSFPIQIVIRNNRVDISSYAKLLEQQIKQARSEKAAAYIQRYKEFVQELIKVNTVLEKTFYIVVSYSSLEKGAAGVLKHNDFFGQAKIGLLAKAEVLMNQLLRLSLRVKILDQENLIKLFYEIYNQPIGSASGIEQTFTAPIITSK